MAILQNRVKIYKKSRSNFFANIFYIPFSYLFSAGLVLVATILVFNANFLSIEAKLTDFNGLVYSNVINPIENGIKATVKLGINIWNFDRLSTENALLKLENEKYKQFHSQIIVARQENAKLKKISNIAEPINQNEILRASVVYYSSSEGENIALVQAGSEHGVEKNDIVIHNGLLAGRIVTVGKNYSKVMLVNSYNSRIPVKTERTDLKAILVGGADKGGYLLHLHGRQKPSEGELILTSGDGSIFPAGIIVGRVSLTNGDDVQVRILDNFSSTDFVEIINPNKQYN